MPAEVLWSTLAGEVIRTVGAIDHSPANSMYEEGLSEYLRRRGGGGSCKITVGIDGVYTVHDRFLLINVQGYVSIVTFLLKNRLVCTYWMMTIGRVSSGNPLRVNYA
jgi:hypothetical protein